MAKMTIDGMPQLLAAIKTLLDVDSLNDVRRVHIELATGQPPIVTVERFTQHHQENALVSVVHEIVAVVEPEDIRHVDEQTPAPPVRHPRCTVVPKHGRHLVRLEGGAEHCEGSMERLDTSEKSD